MLRLIYGMSRPGGFGLKKTEPHRANDVLAFKPRPLKDVRRDF